MLLLDNNTEGERLSYIKIVIAMLIVISLGLQLPSAAAFAAYDPPEEQSNEELYQDVFMSLLLPTIQKEVNQYYAAYLTLSPTVAPYQVYVLSAERPNGYRTFVFRLKLRVIPYVGPHISVGIDKITVTVTGSGDVQIEKFEHIKSYTLPPNYESIIKKGYKNPIPEQAT